MLFALSAAGSRPSSSREVPGFLQDDYGYLGGIFVILLALVLVFLLVARWWDTRRGRDEDQE